MGTISNLATTGNYAFEAEKLKVTFNFIVDNETKAFQVRDGRIVEDEKILCTFNSDSQGKVSAWGIHKGRAVDCAHAWEAAIAQFENKLAEGNIK